MTQQSVPTQSQLFLAAVGEQILTYRETSGLTLADLATKTGLAAETLDRIEHGWADLTLTDLRCIAAALNTTVGDLLDVDGTELGLAAAKSI